MNVATAVVITTIGFILSCTLCFVLAVRGFKSAEGRLDLGLRAQNGNAIVEVTDRGIGIPMAEQGTIFTKFVRGASSGQVGAKGTGIGLAMVRHIMIEHRGTVTIESEPGAGSTFTLRLPAAS